MSLIQRLEATTRAVAIAQSEQLQLVRKLRNLGTPWSEISRASGMSSKGAAQSRWSRELASLSKPSRPRGRPRDTPERLGIEAPTDPDHPVVIRMRAEDALARSKDSSIHAIITDPPYAIGYAGSPWDHGRTAFDPAFWREALRVVMPGGYLLAFGHPRTYHRLAIAIEDGGWQIRDSVVWIKAGTPGGGSHLRQAHEQVVVASKGSGPLGLSVDRGRIPIDDESSASDPRLDPRGRFPANVALDTEARAQFGRNARYFYSPPAKPLGVTTDREFATRKPLSVMEWLVSLVTSGGADEVILDPFAGSGSTIEAAMRMGVRSIAVEKDAATVSLIRRRIAAARLSGSHSNTDLGERTRHPSTADRCVGSDA